MHPLSVFVSSTCYDLKSLREHLRSEVESWGHDPVLSEYPSFPVSPELSTVENCKRVVRERADLLVLIACDNLYSLYLTLFEWELDVRFVRPHEAFAEIFSKMHGWTTEMRADLKRLIIEFDTLVSTPGLSGNHTITMTINAPTGLQAFTDEFQRMAQDPLVLAAIRGA